VARASSAWGYGHACVVTCSPRTPSPRSTKQPAAGPLIAAYITGKKIVDQTAARAAVSEVTSSE
jgi:hypothetical protein